MNSRYYTKVSAANKDKNASVYLADCFNNANWLVKSSTSEPVRS